ncbi:MAG TPA: hypothetical protein VNN99_09885 [Vicinamibacterales bacterium]|jgi:hypothetical protein|nr:hypothetical protein [Vicinamibacterales bacterium]
MISADNAGAVATPDEQPARDWRSALGWSATSAPVALLLITGIAVGPRGINLLSASALPFLNPVVPVALAALGVLVGLGLDDRRSGDRRIIGAATVEAAITMTVVSVGIGLLAWTRLTVVEPVWTFAIASGICAATSLTLPTGASLDPRSHATRIIEAGVLLPILAGGLVFAWLRAGAPAATLTLLAQTFGVTLALATAVWLVLTRASSPTEERVFALSALLLIGGASAALALSALLGGLTAGVFWRYAGGRPRDTIGRDVLFVQHPLLVLVLLLAGARVELSLLSVALGLLYATLRTVGTIAASTVATRVAGLSAPSGLAGHLVRPGVFGVAFALNAAGIVGSGEASLLLATIVVGTIASEFAALLLPPRATDQ